MAKSTDSLQWHASCVVEKWSPETTAMAREAIGRDPINTDFQYLSIEPDEITVAVGNALTTVGLQRLGDLLAGTGVTAFNATRGVIGVGDSATANSPTVSPAYTALLGTAGTGQFYVPINGAPSSVNGLISCSANFAAAQANYTWNEWCMAIATAAPSANASFATATTSGVMLNRKVQNLGTKAVGATWTLNASIQFS